MKEARKIKADDKKDADRTREQLIQDLDLLRQEVVRLKNLGEERKKAEEALEVEKFKLQEYFDNLPMLAYNIGFEGKIIDCNEVAVKTLGYNNKVELVGKPLIPTVYLPSSQEKAKELFAKWKNEGKVRNEDMQIITRQGKVIDVLLNVDIIFDHNGVPLHSLSTQLDITGHKRAEEQLRYQANLLQNVSDAIITTDMEFKITSWNEVAKDLYGWRIDEVMGKPLDDFVKTEYPYDQREKVIQQFLEEGVWRGEVIQQRKDGRPAHIQATVSIIKDDTGKPIGTVAINRDINERVQAEELIRAQRDLSLALSTASGLDEGLRLCYEAAIQVSGMDCGGFYLVDETTGALDMVFHQGLPSDFVKSASHFDADSANARLVMAGESIYTEHLLLDVPLDEAEKRENLRTIAILPVFHEGRVIGCLNVASHTRDEVSLEIRDALETIAAQIGSTIAALQAEEALQESEEHFRVALKDSPIMVWNQDKELRYTWISNPHPEFKAEETIGKTDEQLLPPDDAARLTEIKREVLDSGVGAREQVTTIIDGKVSFYDLTVEPLHDSAGDIVGITCASMDITQRKLAERELRDSKESFRRLSEAAFEAIAIHEGGILLTANDQFFEMFGYEPDELLGKQVIPLTVAPEAIQTIRKHIATGSLGPYETIGMRKDGTKFPMEIRVREMEYEGCHVRVGAIRDITERKQAEESLRSIKERYHGLFEGIPIGLYRSTPDGQILDANPALIQLLGYPDKESLLAIDIKDRCENPKERKRLFSLLSKKGITKDFVVCLNRKDNTQIWVEINSHTVNDNEGNMMYNEGSMEDISKYKNAEEKMKKRLMKFKLEDGNLYLVKEPYPALSIEAFNDILKVGYHGIAFSRMTKERLSKDIQDNVNHIWLSGRGKKSHTPTLGKIEKMIETQPRKTAIFIEGLDYLMSRSGFKDILFFLQNLREIAHFFNFVIIISLDPSTLTKGELRLVEKEGEEIQSVLAGKLPDDMLHILRFVFRQNTIGLKPSFTKIGLEITMSKPTIRRKVRKLSEAGYVKVASKGNTKVIELTERGRNLFFN